MLPLAFTAAANAYLTPATAGARNIVAFRAGFDPGLDAVALRFMQSDGGLTDARGPLRFSLAPPAAMTFWALRGHHILGRRTGTGNGAARSW